MNALVGIDATFVRQGAVGGAEHMLRNLVPALANGFPNHRYIVISRGGALDLPAAARIETLVLPYGRNRFLAGWEGTRQLNGRADALLFPNYFTPPLRRDRSRIVTVIHDLLYRHYPSGISRRKRAWLRAAHELTLKRADVVVTVSEFVRNDILNQYGAQWSEKLVAIPNPISWDRFNASPSQPALQRFLAHLDDRPYLLCVSAHYAHKNLETLVAAYARLQSRAGSDAPALVLVGQEPRGLVGVEAAKIPDVHDLVKSHGLERDVIVLGYAEDAMVGHLYQHAALFVTPSLFEGFGMPAVEALGFGLPVIVADAGALREVTLGHAVFVSNPNSTSELASMLDTVAQAPARYTPTPEQVAQIRNRYDPHRVAALYRDVLLPPAHRAWRAG